MLNQRLLRTVDEATGATCTTDTVNILSNSVGATSIVTYPMDGNSNALTGNGYINGAGEFNGSSSKISLNNTAFQLTTYSISLWVNSSDYSTANTTIYDGGLDNDGSFWGGIGLGFNANKIYYFGGDVAGVGGSGFYSQTGTTTITNSTWYNVTLIVNGTSITGYINGTQDTGLSRTLGANIVYRGTPGFNLGVRSGSFGAYGYLNGKIDQVRIFNKALSSTEVTTLSQETASSTISISNLVSHYKMDGDATDETGTNNGTATSVDFGFNGTDTNVTYAAGKFGNAGVFNGSSSRIEVPFASKPNLSTCTVSFWLKTTSTNTQALVGEGYSSGWWGNFQSYINSNKLTVRTGNASTAEDNFWQSTSDVNTGSWVHCAVSMEGNTSKIYINGNLETTKTLTITRAATTQPFTIGQFYANGTLFSSWTNDCSIDQVRIFDTAISASTVSDLYNEGAATTEFAESLPSTVAYYKMSDATDETGSYDGTPTNVNFNVAGKFGNAGDFNGSSSFLDTNYTLPDSSTYSISAWFKTSSTNIQQFVLADFNSVGSGLSVRFTLGFTASNKWYFSLGNGSSNWSNYTINALPYRDGNWHNIVTVWNGTSVKLYADGNTTPIVDLTSSFAAGTAGTSSLVMGRAGDYAGNYFDGSIDQVRIFNKAITAEDVETLYNEVYCQPTIVPTDHFNPVIYTGNAGASNTTSQSITSVGFKPDLVWVKNRDNGNNNVLFDSIRAATNWLNSNNSNQEYSNSSTADASFLSNGFTTGKSDQTNRSGDGIVSWNWKAGGAYVTDTSGDLDAKVSANQEAGFSIVHHNKQTANSQTIPHGLSQPPELVIHKSTTTNSAWGVFVPSLLGSKYMYLDSTSAGNSDSNYSYTTDSTFITTPSTFSSNSFYGYYFGGIFSGTMNNLLYCFHSVDGYSKIGSYVGTGAAGNSIVTGFRPAFVMFKRTSYNVSGGNWIIKDNKRDTTNPNDANLYANLSNAEENDYSVNFLSNGFEILETNVDINGNGETYIFMAFAEENVEPQPELANSFNTVTYTGNGTTQAITGLGFEPDLVWIKGRSDAADYHNLFDSVRGADRVLISNLTNSEYNGGGSAYLPSFDSDGFSLSGNAIVNGSGQTYVAWCFKASNDSTINQDGSISSIVSANPAAGFSVVSTQSNGSGYLNFGHGLSQDPELVITKSTSQTGEWYTYTSAISNGFDVALKLNSSDAAITAYGTNKWSATSTVVAIGNPQWYFTANVPFVNYCFHSVDGYQKVGSYTGAGNPTEITGLGFRPKFVMVKNINAAEDWTIFDSVRAGGATSTSKELRPNSANIERNFTSRQINFNADGFSFTGSTDGMIMANGYTYIYLAIA